MDEGDPISNINLKKSISKLKSRNIFKNVDYTVKKGSEENLKVIDIKVEEKPTGEISAGAGIGTNGGSFALNVKEFNWLGKGQSLTFEIRHRVSWRSNNFFRSKLRFFSNAISYDFIASENNDKPDQGYENTLFLLDWNIF